jgi:hypothetical protein
MKDGETSLLWKAMEAFAKKGMKNYDINRHPKRERKKRKKLPDPLAHLRRCLFLTWEA